MHILSTALHVFVILAMVAFIVGAVSALTGSYDHWGNRYVLKARRSRLIRERAAKARKDGLETVNVTPYKPKKMNKRGKIVIVKKSQYHLV